jgi:sec-independent protein translocase protein TatA
MIDTIACNVTSTLAFGMPGGSEWIILLILGLLIFGRRLPEVGRSLGRGIVEFKKGIKGVEDEIEDASSSKPAAPLDQSARPKLAEKTGARDAPGAPDIAGTAESTATAGEEPNPYRQGGESDKPD